MIDGQDLKRMGQLSPLLQEYRTSSLTQTRQPGSLTTYGSPSILLQAMAAVESSRQSTPPTGSPFSLIHPASTPIQPLPVPLQLEPPASPFPSRPHVNTATPSSHPPRAKVPSQTPHLKSGQTLPTRLQQNQHNSLDQQVSPPSVNSPTSARSAGKASSHPLATVSIAAGIKSSVSGQQGSGPSMCKAGSEGSRSRETNPPGQSHTKNSTSGQVNSSEKVCPVQNPDGNSCPTEQTGILVKTPVSGQTSAQAQRSSSVVMLEEDTALQSGVGSCVTPEEARRLRQAQQRQKKEEWQKKFALGTKRRSEGSLPEMGAQSLAEIRVGERAGGASEEEDGFDMDELISNGVCVCMCVCVCVCMRVRVCVCACVTHPDPYTHYGVLCLCRIFPR